MLGEAGGESQFGSFAYIDKTADFRLRAAVDVMRGAVRGRFGFWFRKPTVMFVEVSCKRLASSVW